MMKTILLAIATGSLMAAAVSYPVAAHDADQRSKPLPQDYMAIAPDRTAALVPHYDLGLHGPTDDPLTTATGGPAGGLPDRN
jgi:hypothetical protein